MNDKRLRKKPRRQMRMTRRELDAWMDPIWNAVIRRIRRGQSMTANEVLDELRPPPEQREELVLFLSHLFAALERRGYVSPSMPRCKEK